MIDCHKSDVAKSRDELENEKQRRKELETENARLLETIKHHEEIIDETIAHNQQLEKINEELRAEHACFRYLPDELAVKDEEIIRLKAMLFDLLAVSK